MKRFLLWIVLLGLSAIQPAQCAETQVKAASVYYDADFHLQNGAYPRLGFGSLESDLKFMWNQVSLIKIYFYNQAGIGGNTISGVDFYPFDPSTETIEDGMKRIANTELNRVLGVTGWSPNQRLTIKFLLCNDHGLPEFTTTKTNFVPALSASAYTVPLAVITQARFISSLTGDGLSEITWGGIQRASLHVYNRSDGKLVFHGDSKDTELDDPNLFVVRNVSLVIAHKWQTNQYNLVLNVHVIVEETGEEMSVTYDGNGNQVYPYGIPPLIGLNPKKLGTLTISGGAPRTTVGIKRYKDLSAPPTISVITLDEVGSAVWTDPDYTSPTQFFSADPHVGPEPTSR